MVVAASIWLLLARLVWKRSVGETVIGAFGSAYVNAGNLGLPIAAYALGNASLIVPMLLTQMLILQPAGLMALDLATSKVSDLSRRAWAWYMLTRPFRNPMTVGSLLGLFLSITGIQIPPTDRRPASARGEHGGAGDAAGVRRLAAARSAVRCRRGPGPRWRPSSRSRWPGSPWSPS